MIFDGDQNNNIFVNKKLNKSIKILSVFFSVLNSKMLMSFGTNFKILKFGRNLVKNLARKKNQNYIEKRHRRFPQI